MKTIIRNIILTFSFLVSIQSYSQNYSQKFDSIIKYEMESKNVTEIGYTKLSCIGYNVYLEAYLFWTENDLTYIQKLKYSRAKNGIKKYNPIKIKDFVFFDFYKNNKESLLNEKVTPFNYKLDSIVGDKYYSTISTQSHSCFTYFKIRIENEKFEKRFDHFDLEEFDKKKVYASNFTKKEMEESKKRGWEMETDSIFENHPIKNIHFESNNNLKIIEWDKLITEFIDKMKSENKFVELKME